METKNNEKIDKKLKMNDIIKLYNENDVVTLKDSDKQGRRGIHINDKLTGKIAERNYGISWQKYEDGKWKTEKLHTIEEFENKVDNIIDPDKQETILKIDENEPIEPKPEIVDEIKETVNSEYSHMIPSKFKYFPRKIEIDITDYKAFEESMKGNKNVLLIGPTGSGKTTMVRFYCAEHGKPYARVSLNGGATIEDLVGHYILKADENDSVTLWIDGILTQAVRYGWTMVIDEINAAPAEVLFILNSLLDDERILILSSKDGEIVKPHPDFRLIATCNPTEQGYAGTNEINEALLDRFHRTFYIDYDESIEKKILKEKGFEAPVINDVMEFTSKIRKSCRNGEIITPFSTRSVINLAELVTLKQAKLIMNRFKSHDRTIISDILEMFIYKTKTVSNNDSYDEDES